MPCTLPLIYYSYCYSYGMQHYATVMASMPTNCQRWFGAVLARWCQLLALTQHYSNSGVA